MKDRRENRTNVRGGRRDARPQRERLIEKKTVPTDSGALECCFEIAHVTWVRRDETAERVELGQASEPMS